MIEHKSLFYNLNSMDGERIDGLVNEASKEGWKPYATLPHGDWSGYILMTRDTSSPGDIGSVVESLFQRRKP